MPRASTVSEKVWAQAIHAVTVQKMSLRRAAQLYGVHHMSLHRRVRGRYMTNQPSRFAEDFCLNAAEEEEALLVLREQFLHEGDVSPDDVRYVVRTIASQDGRREIPSDFPLNRWISNFKRVHGLVGPPSPSTRPSSANGQLPRPTNSNSYTKFNGNGEYRSNGKSPMSSSTSSSPYGYFQRADSQDQEQVDSTSESESEHHRESIERGERASSASSGSGAGAGAGSSDGKRCRQSNLVSAETWEKAMDAVEIHGMSLRNAAKAFGVHFAALHRRVKKRALKKEQAPPLENYIPFEDEAGIVRVIHARADLGILMEFDELVDLLNRTAMKYTIVTPDLSRAIVRRFQSRVEQSIRHLIKDWPLPRFESLYRYHPGATAIERDDDKMSSPPLPPHLPTLFPRMQNGFTLNSEAKSNGQANDHYHQPQPPIMTQRSPRAPDMYARPAPYYREEAKTTAMEVDQSPRASIMQL